MAGVCIEGLDFDHGLNSIGKMSGHGYIYTSRSDDNIRESYDYHRAIDDYHRAIDEYHRAIDD